MRGLLAGLLVAVAAVAYAAEGGALTACLTGGTPCAGTVLPAVVSPFAVGIDKTAGTLAASIECQLSSAGDPWIPLDTAIAASTVKTYTAPCYAIRINPATCTGCAYTATWRGVRQGQ